MPARGSGATGALAPGGGLHVRSSALCLLGGRVILSLLLLRGLRALGLWPFPFADGQYENGDAGGRAYE